MLCIFFSLHYILGRDARPISPSSVPLPETPAPPSASVKNAGFKAQDIKPLEMSDPTPEQVKLREEAEKYHQQQLQREQQQETVEQQPPQQQKVQQEQGGQVCAVPRFTTIQD